MPSLFKSLGCRVKLVGGDGAAGIVLVLCYLVCIAQLLQCALDVALLVCGNLVAIVLEVLLALEYHCIGGVNLVHKLLARLVGSLVGLGLVAHLLDFALGQAGRGLDADLLLLAGGLVLCRYVQDAVGIDIKGNLYLGHAARCGGDAVQVEHTDLLVVAGHRTLALQHVDLHRRLIVAGGGEHLRLAGRNGGVGIDELGHHAAHSLDTERQGGYIQQQDILHIAREHAALD